MGDNLKSVAVGDTIVTEEIPRNSVPRLREMVVTKVGRKYLYATPQAGWTEVSFNIQTGIEATTYSPKSAFVSADSYQKTLDRRKLMNDARAALRVLGDYSMRHERLSDDDLRALVAIAERSKDGST